MKDTKPTAASDADEQAAVIEALRAQIAALERSIADRDAFNYMIVHELRAPLQVVGGFARHIEHEDSDNLSPKSRSRLRRVVNGALKMERLIDDLLMLIRAREITIEKHPVAVDAIVRDVLRDLKQAYPASRVIVSELPMIHGDATFVRQVFINLVANALKFSHLAHEPVVEIALDAQGAFVVRDNGIGFRKEDAQGLFLPFNRLTGDPSYPGTGVGLAIVHGLLRRHGGWIEATSREGGPTEFRFSFGDV